MQDRTTNEIAEPLLRAAQVARKLGVPVGTIYAWASKRKIPHVKIPGVGRLYRESEVRAWIEQWTVMPTHDQVIEHDDGSAHPILNESEIGHGK